MTKSHFCPISPLELQWGGGGSSSKGKDTYVGKTHFLTLISIGPRTKNPLWAICHSKTWFLWNCLMYTYSIQYMIYIHIQYLYLAACPYVLHLLDLLTTLFIYRRQLRILSLLQISRGFVQILKFGERSWKLLNVANCDPDFDIWIL